jgi:hypothetical protein
MGKAAAARLDASDAAKYVVEFLVSIRAFAACVPSLTMNA